MSNPDNSILKVRRSIHIAAEPARVWQEFTTKPRMDGWWGRIRDKPVAGQPNGQHLRVYEPGLGGRIEMEVDMDGEPARYGGTIKTFDESRDFTFENDWLPNTGWKSPTYITLRLTPALGGTVVELYHHGFEHTGGDVAAEHAGYEQGWGMLQLTSLKAIVEAA
ncbi:MAG TPA: SRPBCC domain-containing protein [Rhizomicrobium sp.]